MLEAIGERRNRTVSFAAVFIRARAVADIDHGGIEREVPQHKSYFSGPAHWSEIWHVHCVAVCPDVPFHSAAREIFSLLVREIFARK